MNMAIWNLGFSPLSSTTGKRQEVKRPRGRKLETWEPQALASMVLINKDLGLEHTKPARLVAEWADADRY